MRSIQARLRVGLVAILLVAGLVLVLGGAWLVDHALRRYLETGLRGETENLLAALVRGPMVCNWTRAAWAASTPARCPVAISS